MSWSVDVSQSGVWIMKGRLLAHGVILVFLICGIWWVSLLSPLFFSRSEIDDFFFFYLSPGNLALCRFHSSHVALRKPILVVLPWTLLSNPLFFFFHPTEIKAIEEGVFGVRYSASTWLGIDNAPINLLHILAVHWIVETDSCPMFGELWLTVIRCWISYVGCYI